MVVVYPLRSCCQKPVSLSLSFSLGNAPLLPVEGEQHQTATHRRSDGRRETPRGGTDRPTDEGSEGGATSFASSFDRSPSVRLLFPPPREGGTHPRKARRSSPATPRLHERGEERRRREATPVAKKGEEEGGGGAMCSFTLSPDLLCLSFPPSPPPLLPRFPP